MAFHSRIPASFAWEMLPWAILLVVLLLLGVVS